MTSRPWLTLLALWMVLGAVMAAWVSVDRRPPEWDHANHLERALHCHRILAEPGHARFRELMEASSFYPPLAICATGLAYFVLPVTPLTAQGVMWLFLGVALVALFVLGRRIRDAETGLVAALLLGTAPFVVFSLTNFQLDLPLTAMVALTLWALVSCEGFTRPAWSVALGVLVGLGMLTKPSFPVYVAPAVVWAVWPGGQAGGAGRARWAGLALAVALVVALPWYGPRLTGMPAQVLNRSFKLAAQEGHVETLTAAGALFYPRVLPPQLGILATLALVGGAWSVRRDRAWRAFLWAAAFAPFVLFTLIQNKNLRYSLPILPAAALLAAVGVRALPAAWRRGAVWACVAVGALQVSMAAFALPPSPRVALFLTPVVFSHAPSAGDWQHERILADLTRGTGGQPATVSVVPNYNFLSASTLRYEAARRRLPLEVVRAWDGAPLGVDWAVLKTGSQGPSFSTEKAERIVRAFAADPHLAAIYPVVAEYPLPDGSRAVLRQRRIPAVEAIPPDEIARRLTADPAGFVAVWTREPTGLRARATYEPDAIRRGLVKRLVVEADSALVGEPSRRDRSLLRVHDVMIEVDDLLFDPGRLVDTGSLMVLDVGALHIQRLTLQEEDLRAFLRGQRAGRGVNVTLKDGAAAVRVTRLGPAITATIHPGPPADGRPFTLAVDHVRLGPFPVPTPLVSWITRHLDPTARLQKLPVPVSLAPITVTPGQIEIGP